MVPNDIETFYNPQRPHQTLGYLSPNQFDTFHARAEVLAYRRNHDSRHVTHRPSRESNSSRSTTEFAAQICYSELFSAGLEHGNCRGPCRSIGRRR